VGKKERGVTICCLLLEEKMQTIKFSIVKRPKSTAVYLNTVKIISITQGGVRRYQTDLTRHAELLARLATESDMLTLRAVAGPGIVSCVSPNGEPAVTFVRRPYNWAMVFPTGKVVNLLSGESKLLEEALRPLLSPVAIAIAEPDSLDELPESIRQKYDAVIEAAQVLAGVAVYGDERADVAIGEAIALALNILRKANLIV
jgi:hypothetical protein